MSVSRPKPSLVVLGPLAGMAAFTAMVWNEFLVLLRRPVELIASFAHVSLIVIVLTFAGLTFALQGLRSEGDVDTAGLVVYGSVLFIYLSSTLWSIGYQIQRIQKRSMPQTLSLRPGHRIARIVSRVTVTLFWTGLLSIFSAVLMSMLLGRLPFENGPLGLLILIMALSGTFGTGVALGALVSRIKDSAQTVTTLLLLSFVILCAPFVPFAALPPHVLTLSRFIPLAYGVDAFRSALTGFPSGFPELAPIEVELAIVSLFGLLMPLAGFELYRRAEDQAGQKDIDERRS
jgi:ABC-type polysaccharide/polyol phosphate export permease